MRVHIVLTVWHLDVDSAYPTGAVASKGQTVRLLKGYVSWVKYGVSQYGFYLQEQEKIIP